MLDKWFEISCVLSLKFRVCKSNCMIIGRMYKTKISSMLIGNHVVKWCDCTKCLNGVYLVSNSDMKFDINTVKRCYRQHCAQRNAPIFKLPRGLF